MGEEHTRLLDVVRNLDVLRISEQGRRGWKNVPANQELNFE